jgi:hypothetical protein
MRYLWLVIFLLLLSTPAAQGGRINVTIDDYFGDSKTGARISYLPEGVWDYGPSCLDCSTRPDAKSAHLGMPIPLDNLFYRRSNSSYIGTWHVGMFVGDELPQQPLC